MSYILSLRVTCLLAKRLKRNNTSTNNISSRIIKVAILALTISVTAIIISIVTGKGLQQVIENKITSFNGNIIISTFDNNNSQLSLNPLEFDEKEKSLLESIENISTFQSVAYKGGLIKYKDNFEGIIFKGVDPKNFNNSSFTEFIVDGRFIDTISTKKMKY